jgi:integrase
VADVGTLHGALTAYEVWMLESKGNKPRSAATTTGRLRAFFGRDLRLYGLTCAALQARYEARTREVAPDTHRNELSEVKTFLRWCAERALVPRKLVEGLASVQGRGRRRSGKPQLRLDELRKWLTAADELAQHEEGAVAALCTLLLGLRCSEVVQLCVRDIDDGGRLVWVADAKTPAGRRAVPVPPLLVPHLQRITEGRRGQSRPFPHWRNWPRKWVQRICDAAGVPIVTAHGMRGSLATLATLAGLPRADVAALLGHTGPAITERAYIEPQAAAAHRRQTALRIINN